VAENIGKMLAILIFKVTHRLTCAFAEISPMVFAIEDFIKLCSPFGVEMQRKYFSYLSSTYGIVVEGRNEAVKVRKIGFY
jgi:hypothetical protein